MNCEFCKCALEPSPRQEDDPFVLECQKCDVYYQLACITILYNKNNAEYIINIGENRTIINKIVYSFAGDFKENVLLDINEKLDINPSNVAEKIRNIEFYS